MKITFMINQKDDIHDGREVSSSLDKLSFISNPFAFVCHQDMKSFSSHWIDAGSISKNRISSYKE